MQWVIMLLHARVTSEQNAMPTSDIFFYEKINCLFKSRKVFSFRKKFNLLQSSEIAASYLYSLEKKKK